MPKWMLYVLIIVAILIVLLILKSLGKNWYGNIKKLTHRLGIILFFLLILFAIISVLGFRQMISETPIATIRFLDSTPGEYQAQLTYHNGTITDFKLKGDTWQISARILKWKPWASLFGMHPKVILENISSFNQGSNQILSKHVLSYSTKINLAAIAKEYKGWLNWYDSIYGISIHMPVQNKALYTIYLTQSGLAVKPSNRAADTAVTKYYR